jgi:VCBS repeat-containing protein
MALSTRTRIAGILTVGLLLLGAPAALASGPWPDAQIRLGSDPYVGNGIHNTNAIDQAVTGFGDVGEKLTFWISVGNDGFANDSFTVKRLGLFNSGYRVRYYNAAGTDVTGQVNAGTFTTPQMATGAEYVMKATVKVRSLATACSSVTRLITISSVTYSGVKDAVRFTAGLDTNCPPVAENDPNSVTEDTTPNPISGNVLSNDNDLNGDSLAVTSTGTFVLYYGTLVLHADGAYTYTLDDSNPTVNGLSTDDTLPDAFTYTISDGHGGTDTAQLLITIHGSNDLPNPCLAAGC